MNEQRLSDLERRLDALQKIVIEEHQHRLNMLDGCPTAIRLPMLKGTDVDHSSPQYQSDIHTEEQKVAT